MKKLKKYLRDDIFIYSYPKNGLYLFTFKGSDGILYEVVCVREEHARNYIVNVYDIEWSSELVSVEIINDKTFELTVTDI